MIHRLDDLPIGPISLYGEAFNGYDLREHDQFRGSMGLFRPRFQKQTATGFQEKTAATPASIQHHRHHICLGTEHPFRVDGIEVSEFTMVSIWLWAMGQ